MKVTPEQAVARARQTFKLSVDKLKELILESVREKTPVLTGKAQRSWHIENNNIISRGVPYIKILEFGQHERKRRKISRGKNKGKIKVGRSEQPAHLMVIRTVQEAKQLEQQAIVSL